MSGTVFILLLCIFESIAADGGIKSCGELKKMHLDENSMEYSEHDSAAVHYVFERVHRYGDDLFEHVKSYCAEGRDVNTEGGFHVPAGLLVHLAAQRGDLRSLKLLIEHGADVAAYSDGSVTNAELSVNSLFFAVKNKDLATLRVLLSSNSAKPNESVSKFLGSALRAAIHFNFTDGIRELLSHAEVDPNVLGAFPNIFFAARRNRFEALEILIEDERVDLAIRDRFGNTVMHHARGKEALAVLLAHEKIDVNARNHRGDTVLHLTEHPEQIMLLINSDRFDANVKNNRGYTAMQKALIEGDEVKVRLLQEHAKTAGSQ